MALASRTKYAILIVTVAIIVLLAASVEVVNNSEQTITPINSFPVISYNGTPVINATTYRLLVDGTVQHDLTFTLDQLRAMPNVTETETLPCVSGPSGRAVWTGVMLSTILNMTGLNSSSMKVVFLCADGYTTDLTIHEASLPDVLVCYQMNGVPLPADQGFPIRMVVPDHWGYKWAKWVTQIEVVDFNYQGYYETRGWADNAWLDATPWYYHAALFSVAGVFGTLAAVTGVINGIRRRKGETKFLDPRIHTYAGYLFAIMTIIVFIWWAGQTNYYLGEFLYTVHGRLGLVAVLMITAGLISGVLLSGKNEKARWWHWFFTMGGYLLFLITIILGIQLAIA